MRGSPSRPLDRAHLSVEGLSIGDAFGQRFFVEPALAERLIRERAVPRPPWRYTDDTEMALAITDVLGRKGGIDRDELARAFARRYAREPDRGYGGGAHALLAELCAGAHWSEVVQTLFGGQGSYGNGGAMRSAPVGAYFADDLEAVVAHARASAEVTHAHAEGQAGAIAVALAAAFAWRHAHDRASLGGEGLLAFVAARTPGGETAAGIARAADLPFETPIADAAWSLGSGERVSAMDTVPFALWCAARHLGSYEDALWATVAGLGDRDTTCAIAGGVVVMATGARAIPDEWRTAREELAHGV